MTGHIRPPLSRVVAGWILTWALLAALGWTSSALGQLNLFTYTAAAGLWLACFVAWLRWKGWPPLLPPLRLRRFRRLLPATFAAVTLLSLAGGSIYPPNNYDALTYRLPRLLQWVGAGHWSWLVTANDRMNYSAANSEWFAAPLLLFTNSDRLIFLLAFVPYLLFPGLIFSTYRMLGASGRVAWNWMWLLPLGFCYALQAGSIATDSMGAILVLACLYCARRAGKAHSAVDAWLAIAAIALATGLRATNLPLALPCLVALWPARRLLLRKRFLTSIVVSASLLISYLPTAVLNFEHTRSWVGDPYNAGRLQVKNPVAGLAGNTLQLAVQSCQPPFLPGASALSARLTRVPPSNWDAQLRRSFPRFRLVLGELPQEDSAGLGLGVTLLLLGCAFVTAYRWRLREDPFRADGVPAAVTAATVVAILAYMVKAGGEGTSRLLCPYYALLLPPFLGGAAASRLVRMPAWRCLAGIVAVTTAAVVVVIPARPLWPADVVLGKLADRWPSNAQLARAREVYAVHRARSDLLAPLRECLPENAREIGVIAGGDDSDMGLRRPFGHRTITYLLGPGSWEADTRNLRWVVGKTKLVVRRYGFPLGVLVSRSRGRLVARRSITSTIHVGPEEWFVLQLPERGERWIPPQSGQQPQTRGPREPGAARDVAAGRQLYDLWQVNQDAEYHGAGPAPL